MLSRFQTACAAVVLFGAGVLPEAAVAAPSVSLSGISPNAAVRDTREYFTDELAERRDFRQQDTCDLGIHYYQYTAYSHGASTLTGTHGQRNHFFDNILPIPTTGTVVNGIWRDCANHAGLTGQPVNTGVYDSVSLMKTDSSNSSWVFYWSKSRDYATQGIASFDGFYPPNGTPGVPTPNGTKDLVYVNLANASTGLTDPNWRWDGSITGFSVWTSAFQAIGGTTTYDSVRLFDENDSPIASLTFNAAGIGDASAYFVDLFVDENGSGYDGYSLKRNNPASGTYHMPLGMLEPGRNYWFYAELVTYSGSTRVVAARSSYLGPVYINGKPTLKFTSPSRTSGVEYSRDELANAWDMSDAADVVNLGTPSALGNGIQSYQFTNGHLVATSMNDPAPISVDPHLILNFSSNRPILSSLYRWMCFKMQLSSANLPRNGDLEELYRSGWVIRVAWFDGGTVEQTVDFDAVEKTTSFAFPDPNAEVTYCVDLWNTELFRGNGWRSKPTWKGVRLDPHESFTAEAFSVDWVGLFAENRSGEDDLFTITWVIDELEGEASKVELFYDADRAGFDGTPIATLNNVAPGAGSHVWNTAGVTAGSYYVYARITDAFGNVSQYYSDVDVKVKDTEPRLGKAPICDFDGDGRTDLAVMRRNADDSATLFVNQSGSGQLFAVPNGTGMTLPAIGDFDGDRKADPAYYIPYLRSPTGVEYGMWVITNSASNYVASTHIWGERVDVPIPLDRDGDGRSDLGNFRSTTGDWWFQDVASGAQTRLTWGQIFDIPVPGRYEKPSGGSSANEGALNVAVWRPLEESGSIYGNFYIYPRDPSTGNAIVVPFGLTDAYLAQFGGRDTPAAGDADGDGYDDPIVYREIPVTNTLEAYLCQRSVDPTCVNPVRVPLNPQAIGGDPMTGDLDGDGRVDPAVFSRATGAWSYALSSQNYASQVTQFGLPLDIAACGASRRRLETLGRMNVCWVFGLVVPCTNAYDQSLAVPPTPKKRRR